MRLFEVAASSTDLTQRRDQKLALKNLNIGGMVAILPCQFHEKKRKVRFRTPKTSKLEDQGRDEAPPRGCCKLAQANAARGLLLDNTDVFLVGMPTILPRQVDCWTQSTLCFETKKNSNSMTNEQTTLLFSVAASSAGPMQRWDCSLIAPTVFFGQMPTIPPRQV